MSSTREPSTGQPLGRLPMPATIDDSVAEILPTSVFYRDGVPLKMFSLLATHTPAFHAVFSYGRAIITDANLTARERELVILRVAHLTECRYETTIHRRVGRKVGITDDELDAAELPPLEASSAFGARDGAMLAVVDEVCRCDSISERVWNDVAGELDEATIVELLCVIGYYRLLAGLANGMRLPLEDFV